VILLVLWVVVRRGHVVMASWLFSIEAMPGVLLAAYAFGGVRSSSYGALVLIAIIVRIVRIDRDGHISFANAGAGRILGLARLEITQRTYDSPVWHYTEVRRPASVWP
jgi:PAS domain-containing protein